MSSSNPDFQNPEQNIPPIDPQELTIRTFISLRSKNFKLGVGELLAAKEAIAGGFGQTPAELAETLKILWCHNRSQQEQFEPIWSSVIASIPVPQQNPPQLPERQPTKIESSPERIDPLAEITPPPVSQSILEPKAEPQLSSLPIRAPFTPAENEETSPFQTYYPITRRSLVYNWRYLRRLVADGPRNVVDIDATIDEVTHQGFYLAPVYRRQERNDASLLLLLDQNGSMTPFHRFERDLIETALYESCLEREQVNVFYFHNVPAANVYKDVYLTEPISLETVLANCSDCTSILIVSDGGAARGYRELKRIRATTSFLSKLKQHSSLIAWLNPMPEDRWIGSSAEIIANLIPMYEMDNNGLSNAIDIVRGL
ncbi:VWA containing CoxE family protein [Calothrix sp. 336/3]|uniref:VWA containing CoxE family protein n=1 Tax=Calothrix sp. 336/3 TaxID=1337936 RepID=UPI000624B258|nr:VWA containing CoxE family protein [Calothrix sp. 336/3]AKG20137.1 VWA containing CoxE family protein [Calothrix sp. 336/3]